MFQWNYEAVDHNNKVLDLKKTPWRQPSPDEFIFDEEELKNISLDDLLDYKSEASLEVHPSDDDIYFEDEDLEEDTDSDRLVIDFSEQEEYEDKFDHF